MSATDDIAHSMLRLRNRGGKMPARVELYGSEWDRFIAEVTTVCGVRIECGENRPNDPRRPHRD